MADITDSDLSLLQTRYAKLRGKIQEYKRQVAANERKMDAFHSRVSELPTVTPDTHVVVTKSVTTHVANPRRQIASHFNVKYPERKKNQDLHSIKRMEEQNNVIEDRIVNLVRTNAIVKTDMEEHELWHERHVKLAKTWDCPYPHNQARRSPSFNDNLRKSERSRSGFPRSASHPEVIMHLNERETTECSVCRNPHDKIDAHDVQLRFAKLKIENFTLRLRRSYSANSMESVAHLMQHLEDKSTGIFACSYPTYAVPSMFVLAPLPEEPEELDEDSDTTLKGSNSNNSSSCYTFSGGKDHHGF